MGSQPGGLVIGQDPPAHVVQQRPVHTEQRVRGRLRPEVAGECAGLGRQHAGDAIQRIAGAVGTALFAIVLQHAITANLPGHPGSTSAIAALSQDARAHTAAIAGAFGLTFWVAAGLIATALVPAMLLPRRREQQQASDVTPTDQAAR